MTDDERAQHERELTIAQQIGLGIAKRNGCDGALRILRSAYAIVVGHVIAEHGDWSVAQEEQALNAAVNDMVDGAEACRDLHHATERARAN